MEALICRGTGSRYSAEKPRWCGEGGGLLDLEFTPHFELERIRQRPPTMWRYREALPIGRDDSIVSLGEGCTPLIREEFSGRQVWLKFEHISPTGSFKDRGASVLLSKVRELGVGRIVEDSSGNAGAAIAAYAARAGVACEIYVPETTAPAKLAQIRASGAALHRIAGSREDTAAAAWEAAESAYYASHVRNPYFLHGTKTFAYEIVEQLGWCPPDTVILPVGNGSLLLGAHLGFRELREAGVIDLEPRLIGVQAAACAPLFAEWRRRQGVAEAPAASDTIAEGIAIRRPARGVQCIDAVCATNGLFVTVTEEEIRTAWLATLRRGICLEPTSATAVAAWKMLDDRGVAVIPITGHGLKVGERLASILPP